MKALTNWSIDKQIFKFIKFNFNKYLAWNNWLELVVVKSICLEKFAMNDAYHHREKKKFVFRGKKDR